MQRIQATDVLFLDIERPTTPPLIGGMFILDPSTAPGSFVRHRDILQYIEARLHLAPNLRKKLLFSLLKIDEPRLIDDPNFDLEFHVRHIGLPRHRDRRQLNIMAARLMSRPMDLHRPLWEIYIIEGLEEIPEFPTDAFAVMIKLHHVAFDGAAGGAAIWSLVQSAPDEQPVVPSEPWKPSRAPGAMDWIVSAVTEAIGQTVANLHALPGIGQSALRGVITQERSGELTAPKTRFQVPVTSHRVFDWAAFPQAEVRGVRAGLNKPKMNDLVLCIIAGALRRYLKSKDELPASSLFAICPINVRGKGDPLEGGNAVSAMRVTLATDVADPLDRLQAIAATSAQGKAQAERLGASFLGDWLAFTPMHSGRRRYVAWPRFRRPAAIRSSSPTRSSPISPTRPVAITSPDRRS